MKNKFKFFKSHLGKLNFTHLLLIVLILVAFFGLFKNEIRVWKSINLPKIVNRPVEIQKSCKIDILNPKYTEENEQNYQKCLQSKGLRYFSVACSLEAHTMTIKDVSQYIEKESTCKEEISEKWFWALGRYWFKVN